MEARRRKLDLLRRAAALTGRGHRPTADIVIAKLGAEAGMIGVADLARQI